MPRSRAPAWAVAALIAAAPIAAWIVHEIAALAEWHSEHGPVEAVLVLLAVADLF